MAEEHVTRTEAREKRKKRRLTLWLSSGFAVMIILAIALGFGLGTPLQERIIQTSKVVFNLKGDLEGKVFEFYPDKPPAENIQITIDGRQVKPSGPGAFVVDGLATGKHIVTISGERYETLTQTIEITKGKNNRVFTVCLTPEEAARRWMLTKQQNKHTETYRYLYPDDRAKVSKKDYVAYKTAIQEQLEVNIVKFVVSKANRLESWKHPVSGKQYSDVVGMHVKGIIEAKQVGKINKSWDIYGKKYKGQWLFFLGN